MDRSTNRQWWYVAPPDGRLSHRQFELRETGIPQPAAGEVLVRQRYLYLFPGNRAWMRDATYRSHLTPGQIMPGRGIGEVVASNSPDFSPGDVVELDRGWQDFAVAPAENLFKRAPDRPLDVVMSLLSGSGITAYFGLLHVGRPRAGETLLVSSAAGGVGSIVAQLGRIAGCRVVGIAGGPEKCAWLRDEVGVDEAVDYKAGDLASSLRRACPDGVDLFFDNTGGPVLEAALEAMKKGGRIVCCGATASYDGDAPAAGVRGLPMTLILKSLTMKGFVVMDYHHLRGEAEDALWNWHGEGRIKALRTVAQGLEQAPDALIGMFAGAGRGMTLVKI